MTTKIQSQFGDVADLIDEAKERETLIKQRDELLAVAKASHQWISLHAPNFSNRDEIEAQLALVIANVETNK